MARTVILGGLLLLFNLTSAFGGDAPKRVLLIGQQPDGHPRATHEYLPGVRLLEKLLADVPDLETTVVRADGAWTEGPELLQEADGAVLFVSQGGKWIQDDQRRYQAFQKLALRGGGLAVLHWGMGARDAKYIDGFVRLFGGCHGGPDRRYKVVETDVHVVAPKHPVTRGVEDFHVKEEFYYRLKFPKPADAVTPLLQAEIEGRPETVCWAWQRDDGGRSFGFSGLHFHENWRRPEYRRLVGQAVLWTVDLPVPDAGLGVDLPDSAYALPAKAK